MKGLVTETLEFVYSPSTLVGLRHILEQILLSDLTPSLRGVFNSGGSHSVTISPTSLHHWLTNNGFLGPSHDSNYTRPSQSVQKSKRLAPVWSLDGCGIVNGSTEGIWRSGISSSSALSQEDVAALVPPTKLHKVVYINVHMHVI